MVFVLIFLFFLNLLETLEVLFLSCMHCLTSFDHVEDQLDGVSRRFDRLERLVSAGHPESFSQLGELEKALVLPFWWAVEGKVKRTPAIFWMAIKRKKENSWVFVF